MKRLVAIVAGLLLLVGLLVVAFNFRDESSVTRDATVGVLVSGEMRARGEYLVRIGNCMGCHTQRGGVAFAGGRGIETPFGAVYASNLTPDDETGIGKWTSAEFWRALHNGRSADGRLLYPVFPYPNYTKVSRADADAMFGYLRSLPAVRAPNRQHALRFPFDTQAALAVWRALYFRPGEFVPNTQQSSDWNRGAYLVEGLGHCNACHARRNALGATGGPLDLGGGLIPMQNWYAPSLVALHEASVAQWELPSIVAFLRGDAATGNAAYGPMAEVVWGSTQFLSPSDAQAMAMFLKALPVSVADAPTTARRAPVDAARDQRGSALYVDHCAQCHGRDGEGVNGIYPALANNRAVVLDPPANPVRIVVDGGFAPVTAANPRPYGMPPFASVLGDEEIGAVLTYVRNAWGNAGTPISAFDVNRYRENR